MWIILLWLLEICSGQGPGASCSARISLSKVNVVLSQLTFSPTGKEGSAGVNSNRLHRALCWGRTRCGSWCFSWDSRWMKPCLVVGESLVRKLFCFASAGLGWWVGAVCHSLVRAVSVGPRTSGPAHVYWTEPGCSLGKVRFTHMRCVTCQAYWSGRAHSRLVQSLCVEPIHNCPSSSVPLGAELTLLWGPSGLSVVTFCTYVIMLSYVNGVVRSQHSGEEHRYENCNSVDFIAYFVAFLVRLDHLKFNLSIKITRIQVMYMCMSTSNCALQKHNLLRPCHGQGNGPYFSTEGSTRASWTNWTPEAKCTWAEYGWPCMSASFQVFYKNKVFCPFLFFMICFSH